MKQLEFEVMLPIEDRNLVNLSNSILKEMNCKTKHNTLKELDDQLQQKEYKNIILLLYDGMGSSILDKYLSKEDFMIQNKVCNFSSIFPATTVAATTSVLTGLEPSEHGWLGWDMFFKDDNETVSVYMNVVKDTNIPSKHKVKERPEMRYKTIIERINEETSNEAYIVWPFDEKHPCNTLEEISSRIHEICANSINKKFIYAYYVNPDKILHNEGFDSVNVKEEMIKINNATKNLCKKLPSETIVIAIADHGHIECRYEILSENEELFDMLARTTAIESRACAMKLKDGVDKEYFRKKFLQLYGNSFRIYSKEEILQNQLFGKNLIHSTINDNISDYIAVATKDVCLLYDKNGKKFKTYHAGITKEEMEIPLIVFGK